ncbi:MAG: HEAT repeat domain-containing protein, partial [Marinilabiliales bacterium]|nr:HEAT repeat domain-containing protein [Marinilabiliales bacterium]
MRKIFPILAIALWMVGFSLNGSAQINRTVNTKVADALSQVPTRDENRLNALMSEVVDLKEEGLALIAAKVVPPGTGDDVAPRFILASLSKYVSGFGRDAEKQLVEKFLLKVMQEASDKDVKAFYLSQIYFVATDQSVASLAALLTDEKLVDAAVKDLLALDTPASKEALLKALPGSKGIAELALAKAAGEAGLQQAVPELTKKLNGADVKAQKVMLWSLAQLATREAGVVLTDRATKAKFAYEPTNAVFDWVAYAEKLASKGDLAGSDKVIGALLINCKEANQLQYRAAALAVKVKFWGSETLPLLLKEVDNPDKAYRAGVLNLAAKMKDVAAVRQWENLSKKVTGERRAEVVSMLGRMACSGKLDYFTAMMSDPSERVRVEAINALAGIPDEQAVKSLEDHLLLGQDAVETANA